MILKPRPEIGDATALRFPDSSFDVAVCGLGLNFTPNPSLGRQRYQVYSEEGADNVI